jgi:hypothetical protein
MGFWWPFRVFNRASGVSSILQQMVDYRMNTAAELQLKPGLVISKGRECQMSHDKKETWFPQFFGLQPYCLHT